MTRGATGRQKVPPPRTTNSGARCKPIALNFADVLCSLTNLVAGSKVRMTGMRLTA